MTVYLVDEPSIDIALSYASLDPEANVVLLQDAVYAATRVAPNIRVHVIENDVTRRGLDGKISSSVTVISYEKLVEMMKKEKVINFV